MGPRGFPARAGSVPTDRPCISETKAVNPEEFFGPRPTRLDKIEPGPDMFGPTHSVTGRRSWVGRPSQAVLGAEGRARKPVLLRRGRVCSLNPRSARAN